MYVLLEKQNYFVCGLKIPAFAGMDGDDWIPDRVGNDRGDRMAYNSGFLFYIFFTQT
jgi:hypothetical protein